MSGARPDKRAGMEVTKARFEKVWMALGLRGAPAPWFDRLMAGYGEAGRAYHNAQHLHECLTGLDAARHLVENAPVVEFALWFHDVVYDTRAPDNEERSADLAVECLREAGPAGVGLARRVHDLVMLTRTHRAGAGPDGAMMVDVDLAILGRPWQRFEEYDVAIRREYGWVPEDVYIRKRAEVLRRFLDRDFIYSTRFFRESHERAARGTCRESWCLWSRVGGLTGGSGLHCPILLPGAAGPSLETYRLRRLTHQPLQQLTQLLWNTDFSVVPASRCRC